MPGRCVLPFVLAFLTTNVLSADEPTVDRRPNVVWIVADDLSPDLGCYGTKAVSTPNVDRLAREGVRYTNAFATSPVCSSSRTALVTGTYQTSIGGHHHRTRKLAPLPEGVETVMRHFRGAGYFVTNARPGHVKGKLDYNFVHDERESFDGADWRKRPEGRPFFAQVQIKEPHRTFVANTDPDRPAKLELPPIYPDHPLVRADWANYLASVEAMDAHVGTVIDELESAGVLDDTIVVFTGDHGRPHLWGKQWLYDGGVRVPLIVRYPKWFKGDEVEDRLVSLIDLAPTCLERCGIAPPRGMHGRSLFAVPERDAVFAARDRCGDAIDRVRLVRTKRFAYVRNFEPDRPYTQHSGYKKLGYPLVALLPVLHARGELTPVQARFLANRKPEEELYDVVADPFQTRNLAGDPEHAETLAAHRRRLDEWIAETGDRGTEREGDDEYVTNLLAEKRAYYERGMRRRGLDPDLPDEEYVAWWKEHLGVSGDGE